MLGNRYLNAMDKFLTVKIKILINCYGVGRMLLYKYPLSLHVHFLPYSITFFILFSFLFGQFISFPPLCWSTYINQWEFCLVHKLSFAFYTCFSQHYHCCMYKKEKDGSKVDCQWKRRGNNTVKYLSLSSIYYYKL